MEFRFKKTGRAGFTLIELIVVLVLIGILTALILPEMRGSFSDSILKSTSRNLVQALHLASSRAIISNQPHRLRLESGTGQFRVEKMVYEGNKEGEFRPLQKGAGTEGKINSRLHFEVRKNPNAPKASPYFSSASSETDGARDAITFHPDGTAEDAQILLEDREGFRLLLQVHPITARVDLKEISRR
jgi:prepilin-type N-terminal cleavage/methylation domain-containing protein